MMTLNEINFEELYNKEGFAEALDHVTSAEDVKAVFTKEDVVLSDAEANEIYLGISRSEEELSEESLSNVSGGDVGGVIAALIAAGGSLTVSTGVLVAGGVALVGAAVVVGYVTYKRTKKNG